MKSDVETFSKREEGSLGYKRHMRSWFLPESNDRSADTQNSPPSPPPEARSVRGSPVSWLTLGLLLATGAGLVYYYNQEKKRLITDLKEEAKPGPGVGKAAIGGPFNLVNHDGKAVTEQDFKGNWTLIYFGFTHCPDEMQKMAEAIDVLEKKDGIRVYPIFISVDPERDNVEQVREYVKEFHPRLIGLTGTLDDNRQVAREFRVYYMKTEEEGSDYLVDHSIIMYLMDPQMDFIKFFGKNYDVKALADGIKEEITSYK
ncbi:hypothetical protein GOP47_0017975 [Adiantum capillus-veneris]|uniref:Thioredoxin domain-containing protein n=1 Tax=Adiantum capillus-veneris TaxID=13818 RepID=A0A9D4ZB31_ADICA|nr:hypothetical protein GOP47_0017975 [Adiantum capillus-veneris]